MVGLEGKVALITGASSGIGQATAIQFASLGAHLALHGRSEIRLAEVARECRNTGLEESQVLIVVGDVTDAQTASDIIRKTIEHFGKIDILINNAGITRNKLFEDIEFKEAIHIFETNFWAPMEIIKHAIPHLKKTKGNIINVSSVAANLVYPTSTVYGASKAALDYLTKSLALEYGQEGIRVNSVQPGVIDTPISDPNPMSYLRNITMEKWATLHALLRFGKSEEVAKPIAFLASEDASFITGIVLPVDGGASIKRDI